MPTHGAEDVGPAPRPPGWSLPCYGWRNACRQTMTPEGLGVSRSECLPQPSSWRKRDGRDRRDETAATGSIARRFRTSLSRTASASAKATGSIANCWARRPLSVPEAGYQPRLVAGRAATMLEVHHHRRLCERTPMSVFCCVWRDLGFGGAWYRRGCSGARESGLGYAADGGTSNTGSCSVDLAGNTITHGKRRPVCEPHRKEYHLTGAASSCHHLCPGAAATAVLPGSQGRSQNESVRSWYFVRRAAALGFAVLLACAGDSSSGQALGGTTGLASPKQSSLATSPAPPASSSIDIDSLFDWIESSYTQYFPSREITQTYQAYRYRYYSDTQNYVGVSDGRIYVLGPISANILMDVGAISDFICQAIPARCAAPTPSRLWVSDRGPFVVRRSTGALVALGVGPDTLPSESGLVFDLSTSQVISESGVLHAIIDHNMGVLLLEDGSVKAWGHGTWISGYTDNEHVAPIPFTSPVALAFPGRVKQIVNRAKVLYALLEDGTVWMSPGEKLVFQNGKLAQPPSRLGSTSDIAALEYGNAQIFQLKGITSDGNVYQSLGDGLRFPPVDGARSITCIVDLCLVIAQDSTVSQILGGLWRKPAVVTSKILANIRQVAVSEETAYALTADGQLWTWDPVYGQSVVPTKVPGLSDVTDLACSGNLNCAVRRTDGTLWWWTGNNVASLSEVHDLQVQ